jgi:hypothetical protein
LTGKDRGVGGATGSPSIGPRHLPEIDGEACNLASRGPVGRCDDKERGFLHDSLAAMFRHSLAQVTGAVMG